MRPPPRRPSGPAHPAKARPVRRADHRHRSDRGGACCRASLAGRPQFAGEPAHGVCLHRIDDHGNLFGPLAGGALEGAIFKPPLAGRDAPQGHPVLAHRTHRPIGDRATQNPYPQEIRVKVKLAVVNLDNIG